MKLLFITMTTIIISAFGLQSIQAEEHKHDEHAGHDHAHAEEGKSAVLGDITLGGCTLEVSSHSELEAGKEFGMELVIEKGTAPEVLRAWVGIKNGRGSVKLLLAEGKDGKSYHAHIEVPKTLPQDSKIWFESTDAQGQKSKVALAIPADGDDHDDHDGHDHKEHGHKDDKHDEHAGHNHK